MRNRMKRIISLVMIVMLALTSTALTAYAESDNARKITFPDTVTHWSQKHVAKLASLGIVNGLGDGRFGVNNNISQQDVIVMAVRLMGEEEDALDASGNRGTALEVSDYARPHVIYALSEGILVPSEEMADNGYVNWGSRSAKREWVAKIMVRALDKDDDAQDMAGVPTNFNDNEDISEDALGYVNTAVELGLITGTNTNDFLPLKTITRAETASIFAKAEQYLPQSDHVVKGYVSSITNDRLSVRDGDGDIQHIELDNKTAYYRFDENYQVLKSEVEEGIEVYVVQEDDKAIYVEVTGEEEPVEIVSGELDSVNISARIITIVADGERISYLLEDQVVVIDADGSGSSLSKIVPLSEVELKKSTVSNKIVEIQIKDEPISKTSEGIVVSISDDELVVLDADSDAEETYPISNLLEVIYEDEEIDLDEIGELDEIEYTVDYGNVTKIELVKPYIEPELGTVVSIDYTNKIIVINNGTPQPIAYYYTDDVAVRLEGMAAPTLDDLMPNDKVSIEFNDEGKISRITIENRSLGSSQMLTYIAYADNQIIVMDHDRQVKAFKLTDDTILEINEEEYPVEEINDRLKSNSTRVDLTLTGEYVKRITVSNGYTGVVQEINTSKGLLKITNPHIGNMELKLSSSTRVRVFGESTSRLSRVKVGDEVEVSLNSDQTEVSEIRIKKNVYYNIEEIRESNGRITLESLDDDTVRLYITDSINLTHPSKSHVYFDDLEEDMAVTITYYGNRRHSINLLETTYGTITEHNRSDDELIVETPFDKELEINTAQFFTMLDGRLTDLKEGDRISIMQDIDGYSYGKRVTRQVKEMYRLESGDRISFTNPLGEVDRYDLAEDVIVRSGDSLIDLDDLKRNDRLNVYIVNGVIVEIELQ